MAKHPQEMEDRPCKNGWTECSCCAHENDCRAGLYKGEEDILTVAAKICEKSVMSAAKESAQKIKGTWHEWFMQLTPEESMDWFYSNRVQGLHHVEPWQAKAGPSSPGGGSKNRSPKKPQRKVPEYMKILGM